MEQGRRDDANHAAWRAARQGAVRTRGGRSTRSAHVWSVGLGVARLWLAVFAHLAGDDDDQGGEQQRRRALACMPYMCIA